MNGRQTILIVDDLPIIHQIIHKHVEGLDVDAVSVKTGAEAFDAVRTHHPDLVMLDINLPDVSGYDVIRRLKRDSDTYDIPIIIISGIDGTVNKVKAFDMGAVDFITKPFEPAELRARVRAALNTKALMDLLRTQAQIDGLTGLHNRGYFDQRLGQELAAGRRYDRPVGLLMIDVDHFKDINDTQGHPAGDRVLKSLARLLRRVGRAADVPCRYGGEELAVILSQSSPTETYRAGIRLLEAIRACDELRDIACKAVTVSIGAACALADEDATVESLVRDADAALYRAKAAGRDRVATAFDRSSLAAAG